MVDFTEDITHDSSDSELELGSSGSYDSIGKASYKSNLISNQIIYEYTILDSDNALTISPAAIILNSSAIKDQAGNPANLDIPASTTASSSSVSIDNVATVVISSLDFNEGDETNAEQTIISVSGSGIVGFNYKLVTDQNSCDQASDYISVDSTSLTLDLSSVAEGSATLCALGSISSGFTKPADNGASSFSWIEDLSAPLYPISISGLEADTHQNTMTLTINDTDIEHYRYALSPNADSDCSNIGNYSSELDIGDGTLTLIYDLPGDYTSV